MGLFYKSTYEKICKYDLKREIGLQKGIQKEILANPKRIQYNSSTRDSCSWKSFSIPLYPKSDTVTTSMGVTG